MWRLVHGWAIALVAGTIVLTLVIYVLQRSLVLTTRGPRLAGGARTHLLLLGGGAPALKAVGFWLDRFEIVFSPRGVVFGASYTDINATLPVLGALAVLAAPGRLACVAQMVRPGLRLVAGGLIALVLVWIVGLGVYPALLQPFRVTPNELVAERPFIEHNIRMTRQAYGLDRIVEQEFPADETLDARALSRNEATIKNIRLWDYRPLLRTFAQLQEIRTYYKFVDVDNDRYSVNGEYRQLMLSPRELSYQHLQGGRNWINEHLTFTHGYGVVVGPVNRITAEGLPEFLVKDIPPQSIEGFPPSPGRRSTTARSPTSTCCVRTRSQELDYPRGDQNVYTRYEGRGGIPITSWLRRLAFAARFGELKILLSDDLTAESRIMMYRTVRERVQQIAPFFRFDRDPYLVVTDDGRLVWMLDGYTTHRSLPVLRARARDRQLHPQLRQGDGRRLRRHRDLLPGRRHRPDRAGLRPRLPGPAEAARPDAGRPAAPHPLPRGLLRHPGAEVRDLPHARSPGVLQPGGHVGDAAARRSRAATARWSPTTRSCGCPARPKEEFILLTLFNPSRRDNMIAWLAARSDPPNYGRLIVYNFPKQKLVYGPRQIDARIDQDPIISQQLALWNQRGSTVIRGSLLAIPIDQSLIYVQPLYLAASEQGALPELRRVIVAYGNQIAMEPTLEQSLARIFGGRARPPRPPTATPRRRRAGRPRRAGERALAQRALEIYQRAQDALRRGDWAAYGAEQKRLEETLRALSGPAVATSGRDAGWGGWGPATTRPELRVTRRGVHTVT